MTDLTSHQSQIDGMLQGLQQTDPKLYQLLKLMNKDGVLSYAIVNKNSQSHSYTEQIETGVEGEDFEVSISIRDDKRDNFGFLCDNVNYEISVHQKIIKIEGVSEDGKSSDGDKINADLSYGMLRYFLAPLSNG